METKNKCEELGFVHAWQDITANEVCLRYPATYTNSKRKCQNCGRTEELVAKEVREEVWVTLTP